MTDQLTSLNAPPRVSAWSNRILIAAIVGILFLTLYPFRFGINRHQLGHISPYLLDGWGKGYRPLDVFLNILLFVPFGFGLAEKLRERGKSRIAALGMTLAAGALLSYTVEFLQFNIPFRDSRWEDVLTNSTGSIVGFLLFELFGAVALRIFSGTERLLIAWLTLSRAVLILVLYFGLWLAISIPQQKETRLSNWEPDDSILVVGSPVSGRFASGWKGEILELDIWDHSVPPEFAQDLTFGGLAHTVGPTPLAEYDLSNSESFRDQRHFLPDLVWVSQTPDLDRQKTFALDGQSWLTSRSSVSELVNDLRATRQFALRVRCEPSELAGVDARIVSISQISGTVDLELQQAGANLVFWFRNPLLCEAIFPGLESRKCIRRQPTARHPFLLRWLEPLSLRRRQERAPDLSARPRSRARASHPPDQTWGVGRLPIRFFTRWFFFRQEFFLDWFVEMRPRGKWLDFY